MAKPSGPSTPSTPTDTDYLPALSAERRAAPGELRAAIRAAAAHPLPGRVRFPATEPLPLALVKKLAKACVAEIREQEK